MKKYNEENTKILISLNEKMNELLKNYPTKIGLDCLIAMLTGGAVQMNISKETFIYFMSHSWDFYKEQMDERR